MMSWIDREASVLMQTYRRAPVTFVRGDGCWLYDEAGREYLDCVSGVAVVAVGHANRRVARAAAEQLETLVHVSNLYLSTPQVELAERLCELSGLQRVFFANCGATANEAAIKLARRWGQRGPGAPRHGVISLDNSFHGRTLLTLAATGQPEKQAAFRPLPPGFKQVPPGDLTALEAAIDADTVAVLVETTQGEGGVVPLPAEYLQGLRRLCDQRQLLLIVDDIQAGMGRTGSWFSWQQLGFEPDIATVAKALGNGLPIGACLAREQVASAFAVGDHATTFGGGPVVCRVALAVIAEIEERGLLDNCRERSAQLQRALARLEGVEAVRGRGLLLAVILNEVRAAEIAERALGQRLLVNPVRPNVLRLAPPLTLSANEADEAVRRLGRALER